MSEHPQDEGRKQLSGGLGVLSLLLAHTHAAPLGWDHGEAGGGGAASTYPVRDWRWDLGEGVRGEDTEKKDHKAESSGQFGGDSCADVTGSQDLRVLGEVNGVKRTG